MNRLRLLAIISVVVVTALVGAQSGVAAAPICARDEFVKRDDVRYRWDKDGRGILAYDSGSNACQLDIVTGRITKARAGDVRMPPAQTHDRTGNWVATGQISRFSIQRVDAQWTFTATATLDASTSGDPSDIRAGAINGLISNNGLWNTNLEMCKLRARFVGSALIVSQNPGSECGGQGIDFTGVYHKEG